MTAVVLEGVEKSYGEVSVLRGIDQVIPEGCFFTLLGPSGCGKTTLLRIIAGFVEPTRGVVRFGAEDISRRPAHKRQVGMVFQDYALFPHLSTFENVAYGLRARRFPSAAIKQKVLEYLDRVGLSGLGDRFPAELSGGQMQRVALARALVVEPRVLLMDEPLSNLDASLRIQMREVIRKLQLDTHTTTIFVTHDQEEALVLSDKVAVMRGGIIEQCGTPLDVYRKPATAYVADFVGAANLLPARWINGPESALEILGRRLRMPTATKPNLDFGLLVLRPEDVMLYNSSGEGSIEGLSGKIEWIQFQGDRTSYVITVGDGTRITARASGAGVTDAFQIGDNVKLVIDQDPWIVPEDPP